MLNLLTKSLIDTVLLFISLYTFSFIFILIQKILLYLSKRVSFTPLVYVWQTACFIHELCHAVACIVFFHKIIRFAISPQPMVIHVYNKNNPYQSIGSFFISFSPAFFALFILYLLDNNYWRLLLLPFLSITSAPSWQDMKIPLSKLFFCFAFVFLISSTLSLVKIRS